HILVPVVLQGAHLDAVDGRADSLDRLAAERTEPGALDSAAHRLHLAVERAPTLVQGERLLLGGRAVPDVSVWAFEGRAPGETSPVIEGPAAYYVFRLDSLTPERVPTLAEIRGLAQARRRAAPGDARPGAPGTNSGVCHGVARAGQDRGPAQGSVSAAKRDRRVKRPGEGVDASRPAAWDARPAAARLAAR